MHDSCHIKCDITKRRQRRDTHHVKIVSNKSSILLGGQRGRHQLGSRKATQAGRTASAQTPTHATDPTHGLPTVLAPSLLLGRTATPWRTTSAEASASTVAIDRGAARWRTLATLLANVNVDNRRLAVVGVTDADTALAASGPWERSNEASASSVEGSELDEGAGLVPHNLDVLEGTETLRQGALQTRVGDSLYNTLYDWRE